MGLKYELQSIISGFGQPSTENLIKTAAHHIGKSQKTGGALKEQEFTKEQETKKLIEWVDAHDYWFKDHDESRFIASGAEQSVFLYHDPHFVYKLNDTIFYKTWLDYFHSLLLHNYFFSSTSYELLGFYLREDTLFATVKQPYVEITEPTNNDLVKEFLETNGFQLRRNHDYFNSEIGIILEDLHDENVLTNNGVLFFVDTVFYLHDSFFESE